MSANRKLLVRVARKVEPLLDRLVFVGGAVAELYFSDPASDRVRPTSDADAVCEAASYTELHGVGDQLRDLGFRQSLQEGDPPYRWRSGPDVLDLMGERQDALASSWKQRLETPLAYASKEI